MYEEPFLKIFNLLFQVVLIFWGSALFRDADSIIGLL